MLSFISKIFSEVLIYLIKLYQYLISPSLGNNCRFYPTCSGYGIEALQKHSILKAIFLILRRLLSCHPWGREGYDPVPKDFSLKRFFISRLYVIKRRVLKSKNTI